MTTLKAQPWLTEVLNRSILVTGAPRSGTTLVGNLFHSCEGIEYLFEPQVVLPLLPLLGSLDDSTWRCLFETTLVAEGMADRIAGRSINLNPYDESSFLAAIRGANRGDRRAIFEPGEDRWDRSWSRAETTQECLRRTLVWKSPEAGIWARDLQHLYPGMRIVAIWRDPGDVVESMVRRKWFEHPQEYRWFHQEDGTPFWWKPGPMLPLWSELGAAGRGLALWCSTWDSLMDVTCWGVHYDKLVAKPQEVFSKVATALSLVPGTMTPLILDAVRQPQRHAPLVEGRLPQLLEAWMRESIDRYRIFWPSLFEEGVCHRKVRPSV